MKDSSYFWQNIYQSFNKTNHIVTESWLKLIVDQSEKESTMTALFSSQLLVDLTDQQTEMILGGNAATRLKTGVEMEVIEKQILKGKIEYGYIKNISLVGPGSNNGHGNNEGGIDPSNPTYEPAFEDENVLDTELKPGE